MTSPTAISPTARLIEQRVRALTRDRPRPLVLAVSGGLDSMALLHAASRVARGDIAVVATFDHASGPHSRRAAALVAVEAASRALPVVVGRAAGSAAREAEWRAARWEFLRSVAERTGGVVVTAHTEDDQVETVFMRALRGAGARGLAGLYAPGSDIRRPFIGVRRAELAAYAASRGVRWLDDPTNESRRYLRNRVRHELLPALARVRPTLECELLGVARRAAAWRAEVEALAAMITSHVRPEGSSWTLSVALADLTGHGAESLAVLWPALAAKVGLALDWRGTQRLVAFTSSPGRAGASIQLSGDWRVIRGRDRLTLRRARAEGPPPAGLPVDGALRWGRWSFAREQGSGRAGAWHAVLPSGRPLVVRAWRPGDRMVGANGRLRRVKRFFGDAGVVGPERAGWPVVLAGEEIVWIPGIGHPPAYGISATVNGASCPPGLIYSCELNDRR